MSAESGFRFGWLFPRFQNAPVSLLNATAKGTVTHAHAEKPILIVPLCVNANAKKMQPTDVSKPTIKTKLNQEYQAMCKELLNYMCSYDKTKLSGPDGIEF